MDMSKLQMLKNIFVKEKKYLHKHLSIPLHCVILPVILHIMFLLFCIMSSVGWKDAVSAHFFLEKIQKKPNLFNWTLEEASVCMNCLDVFFIVLTVCKLAFFSPSLYFMNNHLTSLTKPDCAYVESISLWKITYHSFWAFFFFFFIGYCSYSLTKHT